MKRVCDRGLGVRIAMTFEHMLACWTAVRIEGEKPPETSVPIPTCWASRCRVSEREFLHVGEGK